MVHKKKRRSLVDQLIGRQIVLLGILLLVVGVSQYLILRSVLLHTTARSLHDEISVLTPIIHHTLADRGIAGFTHIAKLLVSRLKAPGVEVVITNALGHPMASSSTLKAQIPGFYNAPYFLWNHRVVVDAVIGNPYYPSGYVWLLSSVGPLHSILRRDAELYVFLASVSLIIAGWLGSLSMRQTLHPLEQIRQSTQRIASGEFGHVTPIDRAPLELHDLGESIDSMSESIQSLFAQEKALSEQMRQFVADASHELRTPLTAITGFLDLMAQDELTPDEQARGLRAIRSQGQRMGRLVNQLLTLSRMDSAPWAQLVIGPVQLDQWIRDLLPEITQILHGRPLTTDLKAATVLADPERLKDVLFNLLDNIHHYTPDDTAVSVSVRVVEQRVHLEVEDTGPGINADDLPFIFDRFYRGDRARSSVSGGSGLGLSIAKSVVEALSGTIVTETHDPHGTRFIVSLPIAPQK